VASEWGRDLPDGAEPSLDNATRIPSEPTQVPGPNVRRAVSSLSFGGLAASQSRHRAT
jgi:hypothetical protein